MVNFQVFSQQDGRAVRRWFVQISLSTRSLGRSVGFTFDMPRASFRCFDGVYNEIVRSSEGLNEKRERDDALFSSEISPTVDETCRPMFSSDDQLALRMEHC